VIAFFNKLPPCLVGIEALKPALDPADLRVSCHTLVMTSLSALKRQAQTQSSMRSHDLGSLAPETASVLIGVMGH
jgi:hypothetical protein